MTYPIINILILSLNKNTFKAGTEKIINFNLFLPPNSGTYSFEEFMASENKCLYFNLECI